MESKVPEEVHALIDQFILLCNRKDTPEDEVLVLKACVANFEQALAEGGATDPTKAMNNLHWFKVRLDELGAGEVRA